MVIGIDIDGVLLDSEKEFRVAEELYDMLVLNKNSIKNIEEPRFQDRYNWNEEENNKFIDDYLIELSKICNIMPGAKKVIDLLKKDGHTLIIITARGGHNIEMKYIAKEKLKKAGIFVDKEYWQTKDKVAICKKENVDIMIDDFYKICEQTAKEKIRTLYLREAGMKKLNNEYIIEVHNWGEIYRYIKNCDINNIS